jgi:uncharacterized coiled-coil protein SlyX
MPKLEAIRKQDLVEHLAQVQALSRAIGFAIAAIEKNNLRELETQLATQETICNRLSGNKLVISSISKVEAVRDETAHLLQQIRQAHLALAQLNRVYAALLKRSRRHLGQITALYGSHGEGYDRGPSTLPQRHTWSCEV